MKPSGITRKSPVSTFEPSRWRDGRGACFQGGLPSMLKSACLGEQLGASDDLGYVYVVRDVWYRNTIQNPYPD
jgi:hypothetical protein